MYNLLETTFVPDNTMTLLQSLHITLKLLSDTIQNSIGMDRATLWISHHSYISHSTRDIEQEIDTHMPPDWTYHIHKYDHTESQFSSPQYTMRAINILYHLSVIRDV